MRDLKLVARLMETVFLRRNMKINTYSTTKPYMAHTNMPGRQ